MVIRQKYLGQIAYEAYCEKSQGVSLVSGAKLPDWDHQGQDIREAWDTAAYAVADIVRDNLMKGN